MGEVLNIQVGDVYHLWCSVCTPQKYKFYVIAYTEPRLRYMLINSDPARFQQENDELMRHQLNLRASDHSFLQYDSVLDCSSVLGGLNAADLTAAYLENNAIHIGAIDPSSRQELREIVVNSQVLTERDKRMLLESW